MVKLYTVHPDNSKLLDSPNTIVQELNQKAWLFNDKNPSEKTLAEDLSRSVKINGETFDKQKETVDAFLTRTIKNPKHRDNLKTFYNQSLVSVFHAIFKCALTPDKQALASGHDFDIEITEKDNDLLITSQLNTLTLIDVATEKRPTLAGSVEIQFKITDQGAKLNYMGLSNPTLLNSLFHQADLYFDAFHLQKAQDEHALSEIAMQYDVGEDIRKFFRDLFKCKTEALTLDKQQQIMREVARYLNQVHTDQKDAQRFLTNIKSIISNEPFDISNYMTPTAELLAGSALVGAAKYFENYAFFKATFGAAGGLMVGDAVNRFSDQLFNNDKLVQAHPELQELVSQLSTLSATKLKITDKRPARNLQKEFSETLVFK